MGIRIVPTPFLAPAAGGQDWGLGVEPRALCVLGKCSTTELHSPTPLLFFFFLSTEYVHIKLSATELMIKPHSVCCVVRTGPQQRIGGASPVEEKAGVPGEAIWATSCRSHEVSESQT